MPVSEKSLANLRAHKWKPGQSGNPNGRPKSRVPEHMSRILSKTEIKKRYAMTPEEVNEWEQALLVLTKDELVLVAKSDPIPAYAKGLAVAILTDMKNGKTTTLAQLRERQYGAVKQKVEVTGANGQPLMQQKELTPKQAKSLIENVLNSI